MPIDNAKNEKLPIQVYKKIKDKLLYLEILPGTTLQERDVANMFSVSRTPIREAVQKLAIEGWVEINSRKSIVVK
ncbi:MAG TPA: GntR family transcriptional regulator, partial [Candidatus Atribacteria bacterium]|nr:GntR family transcriptional regulator [Candidatus Atribacteria bacterium]